MKKLIINGEIAIIEAEQYFPFTYKLSDLEEINVINFPSTKSVILPRGTQNDEIFGHIAEITRLNTYGEDNKVGVSFNQFKKGQYELLNGSELVSKGIIRIVNITEEGYEIELYDQAIELLEILEEKFFNGSKEGDANEPGLEIINPQTGLPLNVMVNYASVADMLVKDYGVTPIFGDYDTQYEVDSILGKTDVALNAPLVKLNLPETLTPLQLRTFPAGDIPYTIKLTKIFDMLLSSKDLEIRGKVIFSTMVRKLLENVYMLLKKPENGLLSTTTEMWPDTATKSANDKDTLVWHNYNWLVKDAFWYTIFNGEYRASYEYDFKVETTQTGNVITQYDGVSYTTANALEGDMIGILAVDTQVNLMGGTFSRAIFTKIPLYLGRNAVYSNVGGKRVLHCKGTFVTSMNIHQKEANGSTARVYHTFSGRRWGAGTSVYRGKDLNFFGFEGDSGKFTVTSTVTPTITHKYLDFTEYDMLTSDKLLPDMTIKDFIIDLAKSYNFNITAKNNGLYVDVKRYKETDEVILIDGQPDIDVSKVDFSKLVISNQYPDSELIKEYEEKLGKPWTSKIINTGYSIKKSKEEIELPYGTSLPIVDYNYFAYDYFGEYLNAGYATVATGDVRNISGNIVLGYIQRNDDKIYITDTERREDKPVLANHRLTLIDGRWKFDDDIAANISKVDTYPTFVPYRLVDGVIVESLEFNKPEYNFANITDAEYPQGVNMYDRFHRGMLIDKFNADTHILTAQLFIDGVAGIGNIYNYKNSNYIIAELTEYDPTEPGLYEVKLMRVNDIKNYTTLPPLPADNTDPDVPTVDVIGVDSLSPITVPWGTEPRFLDLPTTVTVQLTSRNIVCRIGWLYAAPYYDPYTSGPYTWRGRLELPIGVSNPNGIEASILVTVAKEEGAGPKYNNKFAYVVEAFFEGDLRNNNNLGGFESKVKVSDNNEPYITRLDHSLVIPNLTYANGETKSVFTGEIDSVWQTTKLYKVFTEQAIRYQLDGRNAEYNLGDSTVVNFNGLTNGSGVILEINVPQIIPTESATSYLTTPIRLDDLKKTILFTGSDYYELAVEMRLINNTTQLHNAYVRVQGFTVTGPEGVRYIDGNDFTSVTTSSFNEPGGVQVLINIRIPSVSPSSGYSAEDFEVVMDKGITIKPANTPSYITIGAETAYKTTAVSRFDFFAYQDLINITGNNKTGASSSIKLLRWKVTYNNTAQLI